MAADECIREFQNITMNLLLMIIAGAIGLIVLAFVAIQCWFYLINKND